VTTTGEQDTEIPGSFMGPMGIPWKWVCVTFVHENGDGNKNGKVGMGGMGNKVFLQISISVLLNNLRICQLLWS